MPTTTPKTPTPTHVVSNGRRYGCPGSHHNSARHAAVADGPDCYRTLCGRRWHRYSEEEIGGQIHPIGSAPRVTCKRCRVKVAAGSSP